MKSEAPDLLGRRFGRLLVTERLPNNKHNRAVWRTSCDCGSVHDISSLGLLSGDSTSCGCYRDEMRAVWHRTHGESKTSEYGIWHGMLTRCYNPTFRNYRWYGGLGVTVCLAWRESYHAFLADMGRRPDATMSLDRIDPSGNYEPGNCRWATRQQQAMNKRGTVLIEHDGIADTVQGWERRMGFSGRTIRTRMEHGMTFQEAISKPVKPYRPRGKSQ